MSGPTLVVLAAGLGSRYGGLKQVEGFGPSGETLMDYSVYDAARHGFGRVVVVIRPGLEEPLAARVARWRAHGLDVAFAEQRLDDVPRPVAARRKPWGTAHAILAAARAVDGPFAMVNADDFYGARAFGVVAEHLRADTAGALVGYRLRDTLSAHGGVSRGVCHVDERGWLREVMEVAGLAARGDGVVSRDATGTERRWTGDEVVSMNLWAFPPDVFPLLRRALAEFLARHGDDPEAEFPIPDAVNGMVAAGALRVRVLRAEARWFGVTHPADRAPVQVAIAQLVARGEYPPTLFHG